MMDDDVQAAARDHVAGAIQDVAASRDRQEALRQALVGEKHLAAYGASPAFRASINQLALMVELWVDGIATEDASHEEAVRLQRQAMAFGPDVRDIVDCLNEARAEVGPDRTGDRPGSLTIADGTVVDGAGPDRTTQADRSARTTGQDSPDRDDERRSDR